MVLVDVFFILSYFLERYKPKMQKFKKNKEKTDSPAETVHSSAPNQAYLLRIPAEYGVIRARIRRF